MTPDVAYWLLFTVTMTTILIGWRREIVRARNAARARDQRRHPSSRIDHGAATVRAMQVYAAVPELRSLPVEDAAPWAAMVAEIQGLPTYRGGQR